MMDSGWVVRKFLFYVPDQVLAIVHCWVNFLLAQRKHLTLCSLVKTMPCRKWIFLKEFFGINTAACKVSFVNYCSVVFVQLFSWIIEIEPKKPYTLEIISHAPKLCLSPLCRQDCFSHREIILWPQIWHLHLRVSSEMWICMARDVKRKQMMGSG